MRSRSLSPSTSAPDRRLKDLVKYVTVTPRVRRVVVSGMACAVLAGMWLGCGSDAVCPTGTEGSPCQLVTDPGERPDVPTADASSGASTNGPSDANAPDDATQNVDADSVDSTMNDTRTGSAERVLVHVEGTKVVPDVDMSLHRGRLEHIADSSRLAGADGARCGQLRGDERQRSLIAGPIAAGVSPRAIAA